jgi:hypothetical protein
VLSWVLYADRCISLSILLSLDPHRLLSDFIYYLSGYDRGLSEIIQSAIRRYLVGESTVKDDRLELM